MTPDDRNGLSHEEAAKRLKVEGPNQLPKPNQRHLLRILLDVLREPMFSLLIGGGVIYWLLGDTTWRSAIEALIDRSEVPLLPV